MKLQQVAGYRAILTSLASSCIDREVQYSYAGTATDRPLMEWLGAYAFPREKAHADTQAARAEYEKLATRLSKHGTTTALLFGTMHRPACQQLALAFQQRGLRAFVGKVCMDRSAPHLHQFVFTYCRGTNLFSAEFMG